MERPLKSIDFATTQINLFNRNNTHWLYFYTYGEGQMVQKFDLSNSQVTSNITTDFSSKQLPLYWEISSNWITVRITFKKFDGDKFKGSIKMLLKGIIPFYWCWLSANKHQMSSLIGLNGI